MTSTKTTAMVSLESLLANPKVQKSSPSARGSAVRGILLSLFQCHQNVQIDMSAVSKLTPSFAYEAFGYLYDDLREDLLNRLILLNDENSLSGRIIGAIERRKLVLQSSARKA